MDSQLLERCKRNDPAAQREFVTSRTDQVYRWAMFHGLGPRDAEDVVQDVLATALRRIHRCHSEMVVTSWLYQITRRIAANTRRLAWCRRVLLLEHPEQPAATGDVAQDLDLRRCLARLPRKLAEVLLLVEVEQYTREEVARMLSIPPGTVASRLRLARTAMCNQLEGDRAPTVPVRRSWKEQ